jgi:hypothetical protein
MQLGGSAGLGLGDRAVSTSPVSFMFGGGLR